MNSKLKDASVELIEWCKDFIYGFSASITAGYLWHEFVHIIAHAIAVVLGGLALTYFNHKFRAYLKKKDEQSK